jgi:hypothetical protein
MPRNYTPFTEMNASNIVFALAPERQGKPMIVMVYSDTAAEVALVTPACITNWLRCTGDGNFGTMWGPTDIMKTKFTLDLNDTPINGEENTLFAKFAKFVTAIDDKLLDFVFGNQLKILGRKNLSREEVKMLQIRSLRKKVDKMTGADNGDHIQLTAAKYVWDGMGGKMAKPINVCDRAGSVIAEGVVAPGDVVAATIHDVREPSLHGRRRRQVRHSQVVRGRVHRVPALQARAPHRSPGLPGPGRAVRVRRRLLVSAVRAA